MSARADDACAIYRGASTWHGEQHTVSRILSSWERAGWVSLGRQRMEVRDLDALARVERGEVDGAA